MNSLEARILEMLIRVRQFGLTHAADFPAGSRGRELFDLVDGFINSIETNSATHAQHARAAKEKTTQKKTTIEALHDLLAAIARTARGMARSTPGLEDKFRLPAGEGVQDLLTTARSFASDAEPLKDEFVRRGLSPTFLEDLRARISDVEQTVAGRAQKSTARVSARVAVAEAAQGARGAVRELGSIVRNVYADEPAEMAEWESASHVERAPRRAETPEPEPTKV